jgi:hypothetical protein
MAIIANTSSPANGTAAVYTLLTQLCAAGWIVKRWSDATTLSSDNVNLTSNPYGSSGSGAGNLGNTSAWFRVAAPGGSREWLFQRGSGDATWTVSRSIAGFTGGSPNATTAGTAADATALFSAATLFSATPGRWFVSVDDASPYGWTAYAITLGGGNVLTFLADEPLLSGTTASEDTDPYVWVGYYNATGLTAAAFRVGTATTAQAWKRWIPAASNARVALGPIFEGSAAGLVAPAQDSSTAQIGPTPGGAKEVPISIPVFRGAAASTSSGWCGYSTRLRWCTVGGRANGDKLVDGSTHWLYAAGVWVPWDSSTPTLS